MDKLRKEIAGLRERADQADAARDELEVHLLEKLTGIEGAITGLGDSVRVLAAQLKTQTGQLSSQTTRNDLQDTEIAEIRREVREYIRAKAAKGFTFLGGLGTVAYVAFELWQKSHGG